MKRAKESFLSPATALLVGVVFLTGACTRKDPAPEGRESAAIATVAGRPLTVADFLAEARRRAGSLPRLDDPQARKRALLDEWIEFEVLYTRAAAAGYDRDPEITRSFRRMVVSKFRDAELEERRRAGEVTGEVVEHYYAAHPERFRTPEEVKVAVIFLRAPDGLSSAAAARALERAESMRAEALALAPAEHAFGPLAARHSDDQATRYQGGVAGWVARGGGARWDAAVVDASFALARPGEVSPLVRTADGLYLLKLIDRRPAALRPLREVREAIRHELVTARRAEIEARFRRDMRAATEVWIDTDRLDGLELPEAALTREGVPTPPPLPGS